MRIMPVNCYPNKVKQFAKTNDLDKPSNNTQTAFRGPRGKIAGALLGGAAAVGLALIAAPVLVVTAPTLGVIGAIAGDETEKKITGNKEEDK